jgi:hypothetical protein
MTAVTPYKAAQVINALLIEDDVTDAMGAPKVIAPQMMYNYVKPGKNTEARIPSFKGADNKTYIEMDDLAKFYDEYKNGLVNRGGGRGTEALAAEVRNLITNRNEDDIDAQIAAEQAKIDAAEAALAEAEAVDATK